MGPTTSKPIDSTEMSQLIDHGSYLLYDGACPFCARYVYYTRAKDAFGGLKLLDAREYPELVRYWRSQGLELNDGMLLVTNGNTFYGDEALNALALASTGSGLFNRINSLIFRHGWASRKIYPIMRTGRNIALRIIGRSRL